uniref:Glutathione peroxidase n=1 Tax=Rhodosorus marinus TaxID=101924 RepID=A0A7S3A3K1_9RHOD|mmetsp:Transcript_42166/g.164830  ORF Transcript_42166/g.164830 Transcript_42166/m.164830 type:complete len:230 (+) Transcript_42166:180-869(+)|eukprot:CAMPEP_0113963466 /NCGR_PEP_ID=MMETSP0011_2-20120614/6528_1 /TAXON_ID=101924 /ORGANISM="Rhodosorus marinus" /LENGTH=229 /DNA_ID=CAMNT_0000975517 /DNA_START=139 /DNA_END=828 /DNA_ORIENTATION=+ /assembly_acc=CAM_ASM_000156
MAAFAVGGGGIGGSRFVGQRAELCKVERRSQTLGAGGSGRVSMIAAFGPHRWEVGKEYEEDYIYQYLIPIPENLHDVTMFDIDMQNLDFSSFKGKVVFAINVASKDTKSEKFYRLLVDLHDRYHAKGLEIVAFPCNSFDQRELAGNEEVKKYVQEKYGVEFTMMAKSFLDYNPVFCLGHQSFPGEIVWNFYGMFIFDREGNPADRIPSDAPEELIELKIQEVLERPYDP